MKSYTTWLFRATCRSLVMTPKSNRTAIFYSLTGPCLRLKVDLVTFPDMLILRACWWRGSQTRDMKKSYYRGNTARYRRAGRSLPPRTEGVKCYLESSKDVPNIVIYGHWGFRFQKEGDAIKLFTMMLEPNAEATQWILTCLFATQIKVYCLT